MTTLARNIVVARVGMPLLNADQLRTFGTATGQRRQCKGTTAGGATLATVSSLFPPSSVGPDLCQLQDRQYSPGALYDEDY